MLFQVAAAKVKSQAAQQQQQQQAVAAAAAAAAVAAQQAAKAEHTTAVAGGVMEGAGDQEGHQEGAGGPASLSDVAANKTSDPAIQQPDGAGRDGASGQRKGMAELPSSGEDCGVSTSNGSDEGSNEPSAAGEPSQSREKPPGTGPAAKKKGTKPAGAHAPSDRPMGNAQDRPDTEGH